MDSRESRNDPLSDLTFDDLEKEVNAEQDALCIYKDDDSIDRSLDFTIIRNYGKLSNRKKAPSFVLVERSGIMRYELRCLKDDDSSGKGIVLDVKELIVLSTALKGFDFEAIYDNPIRYCNIEDATVMFFCLIAKLSTSSNKKGDWQKEVNIIDWGCGARVDFRKWTSDYNKHRRGLRISLEELRNLKAIIETLFKEENI